MIRKHQSVTMLVCDKNVENIDWRFGVRLVRAMGNSVTGNDWDSVALINVEICGNDDDEDSNVA